MIRMAALLTLGAIGVHAQESSPPRSAPIEQAVARCAGVASRLDRLDCFDSITTDFGLVPTDAAQWVLSTRPDTAGGPPLVALTLGAQSGTSGFGEPVELIARCRANTTEVFIQWHEYLGADGSDGTDPVKDVVLTIDDGAPQVGRWPVSDDVEGTFTPEWGGTLLRQLAQAQQLRAQITPYDQRDIIAIFDVRGLLDAIAPLTTACNWQL